MSKSQMKTTKRATFTQEFAALTASNPRGALAVMFFAAFGVDLATVCKIAFKILVDKDIDAFMLAITASVQIRANTTFVGKNFAGAATKYPELIIEGDRRDLDAFNFGALHAVGHMILTTATHPVAGKVFAKVGNCITGLNCPDTEAGAINKDVAASWTPADKTYMEAELAKNAKTFAENFNTMFAQIEAERTTLTRARPAPKKE